MITVKKFFPEDIPIETKHFDSKNMVIAHMFLFWYLPVTFMKSLAYLDVVSA